MSAFGDLHVAFDGAAPATSRLGVPWRSLLAEAGGPWIGWAGGEGAASLVAAEAPGWRVWASGDVFFYRDAEADPLGRFAADLAEHRADPAGLDLHAVVVGWEEGPRRVHVWTNRLGTAHCYRRDGARPAIGTFSGAFDGGDVVDWAAIAGFCAFGFYPADRTWREDLRLVRPATWLVLDERGHGVDERVTWRWDHDPDRSVGIDEAADAFAEVWSRTLRRWLAGREVVVPLSGGLDSRTVLAEATGSSGARSVRTFSYGFQPASVELAIARRLGAVRAVPPTEQVVEPYVFDRLADLAGSVEGFQAITFSRQVGASEVLGGLGDRIVGGHWGDVWFDRSGGAGSAAGTEDAHRLARRAFDLFAKRGRDPLLDDVCRPQLGGEDPRGLLLDLLTEEARRLPNLADPGMALKALKTEQWSFRWTLASTRSYHLARPTLLPFYANDVVDLFLRLPADIHAGRAVQIAYLRRHHPDLAAVTWQGSGRTLHDRAWERPVATARRAGRKALRTVRRRSVLERNWEVQYLGADRPGRLRALAERAVGSTDVAAPVALGIVDRFLAAPDPAGAHAADTLVTLLTTLAGD